MRQARLPAIAALFVAAVLSGCHRKPPPPAPVLAAQSGIVVAGGRLVLPAVPGNPGAAYLTVVNQGHSDVTVNSMAVDGAGQAEMHESTGNTIQTLPALIIRAGGSAILAPGGKHVMAFTLAPRLKPGTSTQITLGFSDGSKLSAPLSIETAGGAHAVDDMAGMKM